MQDKAVIARSEKLRSVVSLYRFLTNRCVIKRTTDLPECVEDLSEPVNVTVKH